MHLDSTDALLDRRRATHGEFADNARIAQQLKDTLHAEPRWRSLNQQAREALDMIAHKMARIIAGNHAITDHWEDIAGYAILGARAIEAPPTNTHTTFDDIAGGKVDIFGNKVS